MYSTRLIILVVSVFLSLLILKRYNQEEINSIKISSIIGILKQSKGFSPGMHKLVSTNQTASNTGKFRVNFKQINRYATLNKCLEKHIKVNLQGVKDESNVPLMSGIWNNEGDLYWGGSFGTSTTWALSKSKHLSYLIMPKVGSMTFRSLLAYCKNEIPCDVLNKKDLPFTFEDMGMQIGAGFYVTKYQSNIGKYESFSVPNFELDSMKKKTISFTFVRDPIQKLIAGFKQVFKYSKIKGGRAQYRTRFKEFIQNYCKRHKMDVNKDFMRNAHFAPQLYYLYNAAENDFSIFRNHNSSFHQSIHTYQYKPPIDYISVLDSQHTHKAWEAIKNLVAKSYPEAISFIPNKIKHSNGSKNSTSSVTKNQKKTK